MIVGGAFSIANLKIGWLLSSIAMAILIITRDNPLLAQSGIGKR